MQQCNVARYVLRVICSFGTAATEKVFYGQCPSRWHPRLCLAALRRLTVLEAAHALSDLHATRGLALEKLRGNHLGMWSIRINRQWRIIFCWGPDGPEEVEIIDYH
ncbi:HigB ribonuclease /toxin [Pontimonas salivibrio]|uniref:HigB ribonuclease /toxin n=1 Tax=Pontimonas salivibrio TaxID=1159327 RepID=A0A2L2BPD1_9MICO|nr:HigB ribonuclease /toxin [Pontimonas salivibrio]